MASESLTVVSLVLIFAVTCFVQQSSLSETSRHCLTSMSRCNSSNTNTSCHPNAKVCLQVKGQATHCYALYQNDSARGVLILKMGCWLEDLNACSSSQCKGLPRVATVRKNRTIYFCCCTGDYCNRQIYAGNIIQKENKTDVAIEEDEFPQEIPKPKVMLKGNVLLISAALAGGAVVIATILCIFRGYFMRNRTILCSKKKFKNKNVSWSTLDSSESSSASCCPSTVSPERFQLIKCLLRSRLGEVWIARLPPSHELIKIKICPDSLVYIYEDPKTRSFPSQNV